MTDLDLSKNPIDIRGIQILAEALKKNSKLTSLTLKLDKSTSVEFYQAFDGLLKVNHTITHLDIDPPVLNAFDPVHFAIAQEAYANIKKSIKRNQGSVDQSEIEVTTPNVEPSIHTNSLTPPISAIPPQASIEQVEPISHIKKSEPPEPIPSQLEPKPSPTPASSAPPPTPKPTEQVAKDKAVEGLAQKYVARAEGKEDAPKPKGLFATLLGYLTRFWNWIISFVRPKAPTPVASEKRTSTIPSTVSVEERTPKVSEKRTPTVPQSETAVSPDRKGPRSS